MIVIVDYGMGNLGSIMNMIKRVGASAVISSRVEDIGSADKLILPGVGAFDTGMLRLRELNLIDVLVDKALVCKIPVLGVCLGMQLLTRCSEEGGGQVGLGWIEGVTRRFSFDPGQVRLKIPQMGWNTITRHKESALFQGLEQDARFYFVHSYHVVCDRPEDCLATTDYGYSFASAVQKENIMGVQFHPEKSHKFGMKLYKNFVEL